MCSAIVELACLDGDPLIPTPHQLCLADSIMMQTYEIAEKLSGQFLDLIVISH
jgi:hypothetical protein